MNPIQEKILKIYNDNDQALPPFRQLAKMTGVSSTNTISYHVAKLKEAGHFSLEKQSSAVVKLTLKNLVSLDAKKGVFVILENKTPVSVYSSENIKKSLLEKISQNDSLIISKIKTAPEKLNIAYYLIEDHQDRENLKNHLVEFYQKQGIRISLSSQ